MRTEERGFQISRLLNKLIKKGRFPLHKARLYDTGAYFVDDNYCPAKSLPIPQVKT